MHAKMLWTHVTHAKIPTHDTQAYFLTRAKIIWAHATHVTHVKIWLTLSTNPRTHATHATHALTLPTLSRLFSRLKIN